MGQKGGNNLILNDDPHGSKGGSLSWILKHPASFLFGIYIIFNLISLTKFPNVHPDEGFFSNMAYLLMKNGVPLIDPNISNHGYFKGVTFISIIGVLFQAPLALVGYFVGFGLYSQRLVSLFFSCCALLFTYHISILLFKDSRKALLGTFFLG